MSVTAGVPGVAPSQRFRLLMVYDCLYPQSTGGVEKRNFELAHALASRGHEVTLAGWTTGEWDESGHVRVLDMGRRGELYTSEGRRSTGAAVRFARAAAALDVRAYDVVATDNIPYLHIPPLAARTRAARRPLLVTWHEYWGRYWNEYVARGRWPAYAGLELSTAQAGREVVAVSALTAGRLTRRRLGRRPEIIPNGIHIAAIASAAASTPGPAAPLIYVGRLLREKRIDLLLEAMALLHGQPRAALTIVGEGPDGERLRELCSWLGLGERVVFLGRLETSEQVWRAMGTAEIAVQPSSREGFGIFPLEAMAAGLPVVYCESSESALPELVRHGVEGICSEATPAALAKALRALLDDGETRRRLSAAGRARAAEYDWSTVAGKLERVLGRLAAR